MHNNLNPLFFNEGKIFDAAKKFWKADKKFASQRFFNSKGKKFINAAKKEYSVNDPEQLRTLGKISSGEYAKVKGLTGKELEYGRKVDDYVNGMKDWQDARSELGTEIKDGAKRLWGKIKGTNRPVNTNPVYDSGSAELYAGLGATALGLYGAKTALDELS